MYTIQRNYKYIYIIIIIIIIIFNKILKKSFFLIFMYLDPYDTLDITWTQYIKRCWGSDQ